MSQELKQANMTKAEARRVTDQINAKSNELWPLLKEAHEREAWAALGYANWRDYATAEFSVSQSHAYRMLDQAKVITEIQKAAISPKGEKSEKVDISEREARDIKPKLAKVTAEIKAKVDAGADPIKTTYEVIEATRVESAAEKAKAKPAPKAAKSAKGAPTEADRIAKLEAEVESLREQLTESREHAHDLACEEEAKIIADEGIDAATKEIARLLKKIATIESQRDGHMNTCAEMQRTIKAKNRVIEKLERELAKATSK